MPPSVQDRTPRPPPSALPPQTTTTLGGLGSKSSLEALLSLDQSSRNQNRNNSKEASRVRRYSNSGSRSRERRLTELDSTSSSTSTTNSINQSGLTTPPVNSTSTNWLQRDRLNQTGGGGGSNNNSGFWSGLGLGGGGGGAGQGETLPSNVTAGYSAFNTFSDGSHFFPPGNSSAFSFNEGGSTGGAGGEEERNQSSLFRDNRMRSTSRSSTGGDRLGSIPDSSTDGGGGRESWDQQELINSRSARSVIGGGRKRKDASRGMSYSVSTSNQTADKGLVGLAKPSRGEGLEGRVVVAGKTCLRVLKVPTGEKATNFDRTSTSFKTLSGLAARRSQARGSPVSLDRNLSGEDKSFNNGYSEKAEAGVEIVETMDVRLGSRLGPSFFFSDVKWGYGATSNKIATAFSNGAVVLWDLAKEGSSRVDQLKYEHDRAVNRVVFGGASGSWLLSGGQDGQMKLWDIREARPASLVLKASSPVRQLSFSPSASQPFTLLAVCASGTLIRYDIRYTGRVAGGATDRIAGHVGACLSMDWRDNLPSESDRASGGWVVTGGMDNTIKIWDFSLTTLSTKPTTTLFASQPINSVSWHPTRATELASSPLPTLSVGNDEGNNSPGVNGIMGMEFVKDQGTGIGNSWKNEIEIWDTRRAYFPKLSIKTDEPISAIVYNDDDTIWSTSKSTPTFQQFDINSDSYAIIDSIPLAGASWNIEGELVFVDDARSTHDVPWDPPDILNETVISIDNPPFRPDASIGTIINFDPDFSANTFSYLANNLILAGTSLAEICDINAEASEYVGRSDAAQLWSTIRIWLDTTPLFPPEVDAESTESAYQTPHVAPIPLPTFGTPPSRATEWVVNTSPVNDLPSTTRRFSNSLTRSKSNHNSPIIHPTPESPRGTTTTNMTTTTTMMNNSNKNKHLDDFSEESASEAEIILPPAAIKLNSTTVSTSYNFPRTTFNPDQHILSSSSSDSETEGVITGTFSRNVLPGTPTTLLTSPRSLLTSTVTSGKGSNRRGRSMTLGGALTNGLSGPGTPSRFLDSMLDLNSQLQRRSSTPGGSRLDSLLLTPNNNNGDVTTTTKTRGEDDWEFDLPIKPSTPRSVSAEPGLLKSQMGGGEPSSDSDDDSEEGETVAGGVGGGLEGVTVGGDERLAKVRAAKILVRQSTKSRKNSGGSKTRPSVGTIVNNNNNNGSIVGILSRQNSTGQRNVGNKLNGNGNVGEKNELKKGPSMKEMKRKIGEQHVEEAKGIVKEQIKLALVEYANRGDSQLCATICCVLSEQGFDFDLMFVARVTKAYLDLLRRSKLFAAAAGIIKYCAIDSLRSLSQNNVVHHMACGKCGKAIEQPPYGTCHRCSTQITRCCICHLIVRSLLLFCSVCNHGAHIQCILSTSQILSSRLSSLNKQSLPPHPHPSSSHDHHDHDHHSPDHSHPSTPGLPSTANSSMPAIRAWFWSEEGTAGEAGAGGGGGGSNQEVERKEIEGLMGRCPSCSHQDCLLSFGRNGEDGRD